MVIIYCAPTIMADIDVIVREVSVKVCQNGTVSVSLCYNYDYKSMMMGDPFLSLHSREVKQAQIIEN